MKGIDRAAWLFLFMCVLTVRSGQDQASCTERGGFGPSKVLTDDQRLNDDTGTANQYTPALAMHPNGLSVAVWPDGRNGGTDIYFQLFNRRGQPFGSLGNVKVNDASHTGSYMSCDVAMDGYGHFLAVWDGGSAGSSHVYGQWYLANGRPLGGNIQMDGTSAAMLNNGVAAAGIDSGGAVVVWTDRRNDAQGDLAFQRFDRSGARLGENVMVDPGSTLAQMGGAVDADALGRFVVAWQEGQPASRIMARRFDAEGWPLGASFQVAPQADQAVLSFAMPALAVLENGGFAVLWMADYGAGEIRRQACLYDSTGQAVTGVFRVDEPGKFAYAGEVAAAAVYNVWYLFVWSGNESGDWNVYRRYCKASDGRLLEEASVNDLPGRQIGPDVAVDGIGNAIFAWYDNRNGDLDIYGTRLGPMVPTSLTAGAGFDGKVPLSWEPCFGEDASDRYQVSRKENPDDKLLPLTTVDVSARQLPERMLDFLDTTAENGRSYYYGVQLETGVKVIMVAGPVTPNSAGHSIASAWSLSDPTVDGTLAVGEWDDATQVDISEPFGFGDVRLYVKNSGEALFVAADDANDIMLEPATLFGMLIDSNHDGRWPSAGPSAEGLLAFTLAGAGVQGYWGTYPDGLGGDAIKPAASVLSAISAESGHIQYEVAVGLPAAPAMPHAGQAIGFAVSVSDPGNFYGYHYGYSGEWPHGALWEAAETLGELTLATGPSYIADDGLASPKEFTLGRNYPNPFNPSTTIQFRAKKPCRVTLKVYDAAGKEAAVLADGNYAAGNHEVRFDASGLPAGIYVYRLSAGEFSAVRKLAVVK